MEATSLADHRNFDMNRVDLAVLRALAIAYWGFQIFFMSPFIPIDVCPFLVRATCLRQSAVGRVP